MKQFSKQNLKAVREAMQKALEVAEQELGIKIEVGNARFDANTVTFKVQGNIVATGANGTKEVMTPELTALRQFHPGLEGKVIKGRFKFNEREGKVIGYALKNHKYPFLVETAGGRVYKLEESRVI